MVRLPSGYCIDSTEVTQGQYQAWLDTNPPASGQIPVCSWNTSFIPTYGWPPTTTANYPVAFVDWCDAYAYCAGVGKRLCGKIGGGAYPPEGAGDLPSQWSAACTSGGTYEYPYGNFYQASYCNGSVAGKLLAAVAVGTMTSCQSSVPGYQGVYDLSGNVSEWEDSCDSGTVGGPKNDFCAVRGGNFVYDITEDASLLLRCGSGEWRDRSSAGDSIGFRCCSLD
jgi:formylglycine-generating enzyme required for sulfatase activity